MLQGRQLLVNVDMNKKCRQVANPIMNIQHANFVLISLLYPIMKMFQLFALLTESNIENCLKKQ